MNKVIIILSSLFLMSCISYRDIAESQATMAEFAKDMQYEHKVEGFIKDQMNRLCRSRLQKGVYCKVSRVELIERLSENEFHVAIWMSSYVQGIDEYPVLLNKMNATVEFDADRLHSIGSVSLERNPFKRE